MMRKAVHQILPLKSTRILPASISSRLKSCIKEFYVILDDPHKIYRPGDEVSGQIVLIATKNLMDLLIKLSLVGLIRINSNTPLRSQKKQYLFNHSITLYGESDNNEMALTKGEHRFPFIVKLPKKNIYTNITFEKGEIKYSLKCDLCDKACDNAKVLSTEKLLNIIKPINLAILPESQPKYLNFKNPKKSLKKTISSTSSINSLESDFTSNGPDDEIKIKMSIPSMGYLKGETIPVKLNIKHFKKISNVNGIIVTFLRICKLDLGEEYEIQSFRKDLSQSIAPLILDPSNNGSEISTSLRIPADCFPTIVTNLVSFQYYLEVLINLSNSRVQQPQKNEMIDDEIIQLDQNDNIYNVDRLKKMKNVLTLTSEIVMGTERRSISKLKKRSRHNHHANPRSPSVTSPPSSTTPGSIDAVTPSSDNMPVSSPQTSSTATSPGDTSSNVTSPLVIPNIPSPPATAPSLTGSMSALEEKEMMRLREQALLPSEPPTGPPPALDDIMEEDDNNNVSNMSPPIPYDLIDEDEVRTPSFEQQQQLSQHSNSTSSPYAQPQSQSQSQSQTQTHSRTETSDDTFDHRNSEPRNFRDFLNDDSTTYGDIPVYSERDTSTSPEIVIATNPIDSNDGVTTIGSGDGQSS